MNTYLNASGTLSGSFSIGQQNRTIYQGTSVSVAISPSTGDILIQSGTESVGLLQYQSGFWLDYIKYEILPGETGVIYTKYAPGDCRRYGIFPDGISNWNVNYGSRMISWLNSCTLEGVVGYMAPGYYASGINIASLAYEGITIYFDNVEFGGIFHLMSSPNPTNGEPKLKNCNMLGNIKCYDRLGITNVENVRFNNVILGSDPLLHVDISGKGRGAHLYFGIDGLYIDNLIIEDCQNLNNTDAALAVDGNGNNPKNIRIGFCWIKKSDVHGAYITGSNHWIGELRIDQYSALQNQNVLQDTNNINESQEGCGLWINRASGLSIDKLNISQAVETRNNAYYHLRVSETGISNSDSINIGEIYLDNMGVTGTNFRGVAIGDRNYASLKGESAVRMFANRVQIRHGTNGIGLATGYQMFQVNNTPRGTYCDIRGPITMLNPGTSSGVFVGTQSFLNLGGMIRYESIDSQGGTARGNALIVQGTAQIPLGIRYRHAGSSLSTEFGIDWRALPGSVLGPIDYTGNTLHVKTALNINGANNTTIGPIRINDARIVGSGVIAITNTTNANITIQHLNCSTLLAGAYGITFTGTNSDIKINGGILNGFDIGVRRQSGTLTRIQFNDLFMQNVNTETNLTNAEYNKISISKSLGILSMSGNTTATTIGTIGTYVKALGTTTAGTLNSGFTHSSNRLTYSPSLSRNFKITILSGITTSGTSQNISSRIAINGNTVPSTQQNATVSAGQTVNLQNIHFVNLLLNDFIELYVTNNTSTSDLTIQNLNITIEQIN